MDVGMHLGQSQRLEQNISPQMLQSITILQKNSLELETAIKEEVEANPLLEWDDEPHGIADLFPAGRARSLPSDHRNVALRLKCAGDTPDIRFCFQQIRNAQGDAPEAPAALLAGIGDPERFFRDAERAGLHASKTIALRDHGTGIRDKAARLIAKGIPVVTTEKDACRLDAETVQSENLFVAVQSVDVVPDARQKIMALLR